MHNLDIHERALQYESCAVQRHVLILLSMSSSVPMSIHRLQLIPFYPDSVPKTTTTTTHQQPWLHRDRHWRSNSAPP